MLLNRPFDRVLLAVYLFSLCSFGQFPAEFDAGGSLLIRIPTSAPTFEHYVRNDDYSLPDDPFFTVSLVGWEERGNARTSDDFDLVASGVFPSEWEYVSTTNEYAFTTTSSNGDYRAYVRSGVNFSSFVLADYSEMITYPFSELGFGTSNTMKYGCIVTNPDLNPATDEFVLRYHLRFKNIPAEGAAQLLDPDGGDDLFKVCANWTTSSGAEILTCFLRWAILDGRFDSIRGKVPLETIVIDGEFFEFDFLFRTTNTFSKYFELDPTVEVLYDVEEPEDDEDDDALKTPDIIGIVMGIFGAVSILICCFCVVVVVFTVVTVATVTSGISSYKIRRKLRQHDNMDVGLDLNMDMR